MCHSKAIAMKKTKIKNEDIPENKVVLTDKNKEYLLSEYTKLNNEILSSAEEIRTRERYVITFSPIIGAWIFLSLYDNNSECFTYLNYKISLTLCLITFIVISLFGVSVYIIYKNILIAAKYIMLLENEFLDKEPRSLGWEFFYDKKENNKRWLLKLAVYNWIIYLLLPVLIAVIIFEISYK